MCALSFPFQVYVPGIPTTVGLATVTTTWLQTVSAGRVSTGQEAAPRVGVASVSSEFLSTVFCCRGTWASRGSSYGSIQRVCVCARTRVGVGAVGGCASVWMSGGEWIGVCGMGVYV